MVQAARIEKQDQFVRGSRNDTEVVETSHERNKDRPAVKNAIGNPSEDVVDRAEISTGALDSKLSARRARGSGKILSERKSSAGIKSNGNRFFQPVLSTKIFDTQSEQLPALHRRHWIVWRTNKPERVDDGV